MSTVFKNFYNKYRKNNGELARLCTVVFTSEYDIIVKIFNNLPAFLVKDEKAAQEINKCIDFLTFIDASPLDRMFNDILNDMKIKYH